MARFNSARVFTALEVRIGIESSTVWSIVQKHAKYETECAKSNSGSCEIQNKVFLR